MRIYKYDIEDLEFSNELKCEVVKLPAGAKVLSVGRDCLGNMCLWARVEPGNELVEVPVYIAYTGVDIPAHILTHCTFVGTIVKDFYVYHVFVERNWI